MDPFLALFFSFSFGSLWISFIFFGIVVSVDMIVLVVAIGLVRIIIANVKEEGINPPLFSCVLDMLLFFREKQGLLVHLYCFLYFFFWARVEVYSCSSTF